MPKMRKMAFIVLMGILLSSCGKVSSPKPYGYYRIAMPDTSYVDFGAQYPNYPYTFALSANAVVQPRADEPYWINIYYPMSHLKQTPEASQKHYPPAATSNYQCSPASVRPSPSERGCPSGRRSQVSTRNQRAPPSKQSLYKTTISCPQN